MNQRIIYQNDTGGVSVVIPCDCGLTIQEIAAKDVPTGKLYKIVDASEIPIDRQWRNEWAVDEADLTDGVGA
jgi:hypothetical protein